MRVLGLSFRGVPARRLVWVGVCGAVSLFPALSCAENILPEGGTFVAGQGTIASSSSSMVVEQTSARGIIQWHDFSIGAGNSVEIRNGSGATLNRVVGTEISSILGKLSSTGSVYLINPQGIVFGKDGRVVAGGSFVASTRDAADGAFMEGSSLALRGDSAGNIENAGTLIAENGDVVLVGKAVRNSGAIEAVKGDALLAAGEEVWLQPARGSSHVYIGGGDVIHDGTIKAAQVRLEAAGGSVYALAGNNDGLVAATGVEEREGRIWLTAGEEVVVGGTLSAQDADGTGGTIVVTGEKISLQSGAEIKADGLSGGTVLIGGDQGGSRAVSEKRVQEAVANAQTTIVEEGASLSTDGSQGAGGAVVLWSDARTTFKGSVSATGATDGGFAEISGKKKLEYAGAVDLAGGTGKNGSLLLDPENVTIQAAGSSTAPVTGGLYDADEDNSILTVADLLAALGSSSVTVTTGSVGAQAGDITVVDSISWANGNSLTLSAYHDVIVNTGVTITNTGAGSLNLRADNTGTGSGVVTITDAGSIVYSGSTGYVNIYYNPSAYTTPTDYSTKVLANGAVTEQFIPYMLVRDVNQLQAMNTNLSGSYALAKNIDASVTSTWNAGAGYLPVGTNVSQFLGNFDGQNYTIDGLTVNRSTLNGAGIFGWANGSSFQNVTLTNASIIGQNYTGGIVGTVTNGHSLMQNLSVSGTINGYGSVGGIAGNTSATSGSFLNNHTAGSIVARAGASAGGLVGYYAPTNIAVSNSSSSANVTGISQLGGLLGFANGPVSNSFATGSITVSGNTGAAFGGVVGYANAATVIITNSYATGNISETGSGNSAAGGLVGNLSTGRISDSYATGNISLTGGNLGGLAGSANAVAGTIPITRSYATGSVTSISGNNIGGLVGNFSGGGGLGASIYYSYATGSVSSTSGSNVGGFVGYIGSGGKIYDSYATGSASSGSGGYVGGFVGSRATSSFTNCYAIGYVSGASNVNGFGSANAGVSTSYWDTDATGQAASAVGTARTTAQLKSALPAGFAAADWGIIAGTSYPYLKVFNASAPQVVSGVAYSDHGTTPLSGTSAASLLVGGTRLATTSLGANGAYYFLVPNGTLSSSNVVTYLSSGATVANSFADNVSASLTGFHLYGGTLRFVSSDAALSTMVSNFGTGLGSYSGARFLGSVSGGNLTLAAGADMDVIGSGGALSVDKAIDTTGDVFFSGQGAVTQTAAGIVEAGALGANVASFVLTQDNTIATLAASTTGALDFNNTTNLAVDALYGVAGINAGGTVRLTAANGNLTIASGRSVTGSGAGDAVILAANGNFINQSNAAAVVANGGGRWLVFSDAYATNTYNGLTAAPLYNKTFNFATRTGGVIANTGNRFVYLDEAPTLMVTPDDLTTGYNASNPAMTYQISGYVHGDAAGSAVSGTAGFSGISSQAGTHTVTATAGTLASDYGYQFSFATGTLVINPAALTAVITASDKIYDGTDAATIATRNIAGTVYGVDSVAVSGGTATFDDKNVGDGKTVTATGLSLSGAAAGNYELVSTSAATTADVTPASLAPAVTVADKDHDGTITATIVTRSLVGTVYGVDVVDLSGGTAAFDTSDAGNNKVVTITGLSLMGADAANYVLSSSTATATASITEENNAPPIIWTQPIVVAVAPQPVHFVVEQNETQSEQEEKATFESVEVRAASPTSQGFQIVNKLYTPENESDGESLKTGEEE